MRRRRAIKVMLAGLLAALPSRVEAQPEADLESVLRDLRGAVRNLQIDYHQRHGRYWQGLRLLPVVPAEGQSVAPDRRRRPTDQHESWEDLGVPLPPSLPLAIEIHVYDGPRGQGYAIIGEVRRAGQRWRRTLNVGPEQEREHGWRLQP